MMQNEMKFLCLKKAFTWETSPLEFDELRAPHLSLSSSSPLSYSDSSPLDSSISSSGKGGQSGGKGGGMGMGGAGGR